MSNLAALLTSLGRLAEAEVLIKGAFTGARTALGLSHPETRNFFHGLVATLTSQGKIREALDLQKEFKGVPYYSL